MENSLMIIIVQILIVFSLVFFITFLIILDGTVKFEKRVSKYTINVNKKKYNRSIYDNISDRYFKFVKGQRKKVSKLFPSLSKKYDIYVTDGKIRAVDFITHKIIIGLLFTFFSIISTILQTGEIKIFQILFFMMFGFYILDIILLIIKRFNKKKIENDMFQAVIIMNNAFKSGKSTIQAIEIASNKLPKPINGEFKRIHQELKYGLSMDVAFDRFAKRINIEEAEYLSSSLSILNKTGGNIVKVFDSIEKTLFDKRKLMDDLKNATAVSNLVTKFLLIVPIVFVLIIYLLNPHYFDAFFESTIGYLLLAICLCMFFIYAYILNKIVKVEY